MVDHMADLSQIFLRRTIETIASAYREGRDAINARIESAEEEAVSHAAMLDAGTASDEVADEQTGETYSQAEILDFHYEMSRKLLNYHAQAFALMVYHAWEKHVLSMNPTWRRYEGGRKAYAELENDGWAIDQPRLERLRMVANFIKHEDQQLTDHHGEMFQQETAIRIQGRFVWEDDALRITDDDIADFIDTVYQSAARIGAKQREE